MPDNLLSSNRTIRKTDIKNLTGRAKPKALPVTLLFLIWPFALLLTSLKNFNAPGAKKGFILFCLYFGFVFIISMDLEGADSARYAQMLRDLHQLPLSFSNLWASLYSYESNLLDIYQPLLTWVVSLFTDNAHILFSLFALVFGWFYANNIWIILKEIQSNISYTLVIFMFAFALIIPIWYINGVRMYTAAQIFIYGVLRYFIENERKKGLMWAGVSAFVHFSFIFPLFILLVFKFIPKKILIYSIFFIVTLFVSEVNLFLVQDSLRLLPEIFQPRVSSYTNTDYAFSIAASAKEYNWYVGFSGTSLKIAVTSMLFVLLFHGRKTLRSNLFLYEFACFILLFGSLANLASLVPSGGRFLALVNALSMVFIVLYLSSYRINFMVKLVCTLSLPLLIFYCIFSIRVGFDFIGISTFLGNPITALFIEDSTPIIEYVKSLF